MPIFRVQVNMEIDTDKNETRIVNQQMAPTEVSGCPHCGKLPPFGRKYCDGKCFRAHGTRKRSEKPALLTDQAPVKPKRVREKKFVPWYRRMLRGD